MSAKPSSLTRKQGDLVMGCVLLAFSIFFYIMTYNFSGYEIEKVPFDTGPTFLPRLLLIALAIESVALLIIAAGKKITESEAPKKLDAVFQSRPMIMLAMFLAYIYLTTFFGYIIATLAFMVVAFIILGVRSIWTLLLVPPLITAATYFLFGTVLNIYLPEGSLF